MATSVLIFLFFVSLLFAALFAFLETAFTALRLFKLKELAVSVTRYTKLFASWEENPQRILITILIANNFAHVLTSVLISEVMQRHLGNWGLAAGVAIATGMILVFGEIIPKSFAKTHHQRLFGACLWLINVLFVVFYPLVTVLLKIADVVFSTLGRKHILDNQDDVSEKEIEFLIDYSDQKGIMEAEKTEMLQNIFSLGQTMAREVIVPRDDIISVDVSSSLDDVIEILCSTRFSRLPVYEKKEDNIIGFVHQKDVLEHVLRKEEKPTLRSIVRSILFVPDTQRVNQLLSEFLKKQIHMAVVLNEYSNVIGLVTLEDILEEIVGDIADEHEHISSLIMPLEDGGWIVESGADLEDLEEILNIRFATESVTMAGFLSEQLQHLPKKGERLLYEGYVFQVQQASRRRVYQVLVFKEESEQKE